MNKEILEFINESILLRKEFLDEHTGILGEIKYPSVIRCKKELSIFEQIKKELLENDIKNYAKIKCEAAPVLDNVEKRYLKNVIRPFKDRVKFICVFRTPDFEERKEVALLIKTGEINTYSQRTIILPNFKVGTMYKGMKLDREYTLEELGIKYE